MSKRKPKLLFGNWTMWDLNPSNYSIKNDWVENLIHIGSITSGLACQVSNAKIVKAYEPNSISPDAVKFDKYHHSGSAITLTWDDFNKEETKANPAIVSFLENQSDDLVSVVLYDDCIKVVQDGRGCLFELTDDKERVLFKK